MTEATMTIENKTGIHARPAAVFVQTAGRFKSKLQIEAKGKTVDAKSILMIMSMGLVNGTEIKIIADGPDEDEALKALTELVASKFGEE
ncbi:MAG: HPr family phosphocarrier protein [Veillonellaceae bacterium]|nr:HPr family phosphocarrier protein [Veillonellaceae bacterium]MDD6922632.1 HPr family phosphocarrier protein [Veillonellaceae bacterium]